MTRQSGGGSDGRDPNAPRSADVIPIHRAHIQRDTTSYVGMVIALGSWTMLFLAFFACYAVMRLRAEQWPPAGMMRLPLGMPAVATLLMVASSAALQRGLAKVRGGTPDEYFLHLCGALVAGLLFLGVQSTTWVSLWRGGLTIRSGLYGAVFYTLTGLHAVHVAGGALFLLGLGPAAARNRDLGGKLGRIGVITAYWHFVGVVWALMFVTMYLL